MSDKWRECLSAITKPNYIFLTVVSSAAFRQTAPCAKSEYLSWFTTWLSTDAYSNTHQSEAVRVTWLPSHSHLRTAVVWERTDRGLSGHFFLDPLVLPKSHNEFRVSTGHAEDRWKKWQKARTGVTARTRGGGRASRAKLIGWARRSVTTSCGSPLSGCCLNSLMEPINKDGVCARSRVQPEETAKQAAAGRGKPAVISKLSVIYWCSFWTKQMSLLSNWVWFLDCSQLFLLAHLWGNVKVKYVIFWC